MQVRFCPRSIGSLPTAFMPTYIVGIPKYSAIFVNLSDDSYFVKGYLHAMSDVIRTYQEHLPALTEELIRNGHYR